MTWAMTNAPQGRQRIRSTVIACVPLVLLALYAASFLPFISDDALISLRYADRLLNGHGLNWTDGKPVEGYTNLLWVLACAALGYLGVDLILAARVWGMIGMGALLLAVGRANRDNHQSREPPLLVTPSLLALSAPIAFWAIGGLEQPFVAALLAWSLVRMRPLLADPEVSRRYALLPSLLLGLLCLTRADGAVFCVAAGLGLLAARRFDASSWKSFAALAIFPVIFSAGQLAFRLAYYGEWLPNPAYVKVAFTTQRLWNGLLYLAAPLPYLLGLIVPAGYALFTARADASAARRFRLYIVTAIVWSSYLLVVGGDIFPAHRLWIPLLVLAGLILAEWECQHLRAAGRRTPVRSAVAVIAGVLLLIGAWLDPKVREGREELWEWDGKIVGEFLRDAFGHADPLLACDPAGCLPYFSKFNSIDMMGLNDHHIARQRPSSFGRGIIGHELGDGRYVLDREPDLVIWSRPVGASNPMFRSAIEMSRDPRFAQQYRYVFLKTPDPDSRLIGLWIRVAGSRVGVVQIADRLLIPGVLAATAQETPAILDDQRRLGVLARADVPALLPGVRVPTGRWRLAAEPRDNVRLRARDESVGEAFEGVGEVLLQWKGPGETTLEVGLSPVSGPSVHIRSLTLSPG